MATSAWDSIPTSPPGVHVVLRSTRNGKDCSVWKYEVPTFLSFDSAKVDAMRRDAIVRRDEYVALQKEFGSAGDRDGAKWAKNEATDALKEYRACCLVLGNLLCEPPGDSRFIPEWEWPVELAQWIDRVIRQCAR